MDDVENGSSSLNHEPENDKNRIKEDLTENNNISPSPDTRIIFDEEDSKGKITVSETIDKTKAYLSLTCSSPEEKHSKEDIITVLTELVITTEIKEEEIEAALTNIKEKGDCADSVLIAEGLSPVHGKDSECEILFDQEEPYVDKGQILIRITEPVREKEGKDIYGNPIEPIHGFTSKMPERPVAGQNVRAKKGNEFLSEIFGKVTFEDNILSVHKTLQVKVSDDGMEAALTYTSSAELSREKIMDELYADRVTSGIDNDAIDSAVSSFNSEGQPIKDFIVARGTPFSKGRDGEIEYMFDVSDGPSYKELEDGSIDIRETNVVQCVKEGSEIAYVIPHIDPTHGKDVYGKITAPPKAKKASLSIGKNVRVSEDRLHFFAEMNGCPVVETDRMGARISVSELFYVPGNLDLSIGNIDFDGVVEIGGDVEDGFKIKATKSVIIHGNVDCSNIEAGLDIRLDGGCNGKEEANLICEKNIEARYINEANVKTKGDVFVKNEIVNCNILSLSRVIVKTGSIRGGKITAKKGIESYDFGSDMGVKTILAPGQDFELDEKCNEIEESIIEKINEITKVNKMIAPLIKNKELIPKLPEEQRNKLKETILHLKKLNEEKESLNNTKNELITESLKDAIPEVVVYHNIFHGVLLKIGNSRREIGSKLEGPLRLYEDVDAERVTVEPLTEKRKKLTEKKLFKADEKVPEKRD